MLVGVNGWQEQRMSASNVWQPVTRLGSGGTHKAVWLAGVIKYWRVGLSPPGYNIPFSHQKPLKITQITARYELPSYHYY